MQGGNILNLALTQVLTSCFFVLPSKAIDALKVGASSSEATALAISILEVCCCVFVSITMCIANYFLLFLLLFQNSTHTNAAIGSNLSLSGTVECDASIMDGDGNFGAVGAVEGKRDNNQN